MKNEKKANLNKVENTGNSKSKISKAMIGKIVFIVSVVCALISGIILIVMLNLGKDDYNLGIRIACVAVFVVGLLAATFSFEFRPRLRLKAKSTPKNINGKTAQSKIRISNQAFNQLLVAGKDYTVAGEVNGMVLVKKEIKWMYFTEGKTGIQSAFTITTDIDTFAFQVNGDSILLVPTDLILSIYGDGDDEED